MSAEAKAAFIEAAEIAEKFADPRLGPVEWQLGCNRVAAALRQRAGADATETEDQKWDRRSEAAMSLLYEQSSARADRAEADRDALAKTLQVVLTWAEQRCPCENETPNPCPLCGASVENLEACKSAENTLPRHILVKLRAAAALSAAQKSEGKP